MDIGRPNGRIHQTVCCALRFYSTKPKGEHTMASLRYKELAVEFTFKEVDDCLWLKYEIYFRWQDQYIFRDDLLKRSPEGWAGRSEGALCANEHGGDSFLNVLEKAIDALEPICWVPTEPDIMIAFYPDQYFPFITNHHKAWVADDVLKEQEERRQRKAARNSRLPDDVITTIIYIDAYNLKGCSPYYGAGLAMVLAPTRSELTTFYQELAREHEAFVVREHLEERIAEQIIDWI